MEPGDVPSPQGPPAQAPASGTATNGVAATVVPDVDIPAPVKEPTLGRVKAWELGLITAFCLALYLPRLGDYMFFDPWEGHYGEVARRMLDDHDWVKLKWQNESFRSKPVLTFWLMALSMKAFGLGTDGGFSGEFVSSAKVEWAMRLPFALWGVFGVVILWFALARLYSKRAAWLAAVITATCPFYFMVSRQAITDMPSCAMLIGSIALFALAVFDDRPLKKHWRGITAHHVFLAVFALVVVPQLAYMVPTLANDHLLFTPKLGLSGPWVIILFFGLPFVGVTVWSAMTTRTTRQVYMYWFFLLQGIAVLAKGPVAPGIAGLIILFYLVATHDWRLLLKLEIPRGSLMALIICLPWHFGMYMKDGYGWLGEYIQMHLLGRVFKGAHGERGTFDFYFQQLGVGMWPWVCLVPLALGALAFAGRARTRQDKIKLMFALWSITGFAFFTFVITKFHHYILPVVPGLATLAALWLDDLWQGKIRWARLAIFVAIVLCVLTGMDVVAKQERLIYLFVYRYDRPWPYAEPWSIDFSGQLLALAGAFVVMLGVLFIERARRVAIVGMVTVGTFFAVFCAHKLLVDAAAHWGQRRLHQIYYQSRNVYGVDLIYYGGDGVLGDWKSGKDLVVRSVIPDTLKEGAPMKITWQLRAPSEQVLDKGELTGQVASIDAARHRFTIAIGDGERAKIAPLIAKSEGAGDGRRRYLSVNADRMLAWQLNWRGENFYSGGEIWNPRDPDMQTVFIDTNNERFLAYLNAHKGQGKRFFVITEIGRLESLRHILPTPTAQQTFDKPDRSSNKFGMATFTLDP